MINRYRFSEGEKVRINVTKTASIEAKVHNSEIVTIKRRCPFTWAYEVEELPSLWRDGCFEKL